MWVSLPRTQQVQKSDKSISSVPRATVDLLCERRCAWRKTSAFPRHLRDRDGVEVNGSCLRAGGGQRETKAARTLTRQRTEDKEWHPGPREQHVQMRRGLEEPMVPGRGRRAGLGAQLLEGKRERPAEELLFKAPPRWDQLLLSDDGGSGPLCPCFRMEETTGPREAHGILLCTAVSRARPALDLLASRTACPRELSPGFQAVSGTSSLSHLGLSIQFQAALPSTPRSQDPGALGYRQEGGMNGISRSG